MNNHLKFFLPLVVVIFIVFGIYYVYKNFYSGTAQFYSPVASSISTSEPQEGKFVKTEQDDEHLEEKAMQDFDGIKPVNQAKQEEKKELITQKEANSPSDKTRPFNILVLGIDRRTGDQTSWRTDVIQLLTINRDRNKVVMTHIPRDVWADKYKINAVYNLQGPDAIKNSVEKITGYRPDRIIRVDFDAQVELIDAAGGIDINVPRGFTDTSYPNDRKGKNEAIKVTFKEGNQKMDGETALIYSRSRKGDNGEGSDYARGTRQQLVLEASIKAVFKPGNLFEPKTAANIYSIITKSIYTDISLADANVILDIAKNYSNIQFQRISLNTNNYLDHPSNAAPYGGQWVLIPKGGSSQIIKEAITKLL